MSVLLDAEVSELDRRLVAAHLARCAACRAFDQSLQGLTQELRAAPLESPYQPIALPHLPRLPRRIALATAQFSAAATVLIALLGVGVPEPQGRSASPQVRTSNLFKTSWQPELELAQIDDGARIRGNDQPGRLQAV